MGIFAMLENAGKSGEDVVVNNGRMLVARKKSKCLIDMEVYDDTEKNKLLCVETVVTCNSDDADNKNSKQQ